MLHAVTKLTQYILRNIRRTLCDEIYTHALRTDQSDHLFNLVEQRLRSTIEQHVSLVEEEHQLRQFQVAHLWQCGVKL